MMKMKLFKQTGAYHRKNNICCQDCAGAIVVSNDIAVAAVSDGCSSSLLGHIGSVMCVRTFTETLSALPKEKLKKFCISGKCDDELKEIVTVAIHRAVAEKGTGHQLLSATLLGCILYKKSVVLVHIGDGFAACPVYGHIRIVSKPENRELQNQTYFATEPCAKHHIRIKHIRVYDKLLLSTDGLSKIRLDKSLFKPEGLSNFFTANKDRLYDDCGVILIQS